MIGSNEILMQQLMLARVSATTVVARNHSGDFIVARIKKVQGVTDPYMVELMAVRDAVLLATEKGWQKVLVETDCQTISHEWRLKDFRSMGGHVLREISSHLTFRVWTYSERSQWSGSLVCKAWGN